MASSFAGYYENVAIDDKSEKLLKNAVISLYLPDTNTVVDTYTGRTRSAIRGAITTDNGGFFWLFVDPGFYDIRIGNGAPRRIRIDEDNADTLSRDELGVTVARATTKYVDLETEGCDVTGETDMWSWLQTRLPSWANQGIKVRVGKGRIRLSRGLDLPNGIDFEVTVPRPKWLYKGEPAFAFIPTASFQGDYMLSFGVASAINNFGRLKDVVCYGIETSNGVGSLAGVHGMKIVGETFGLKLENCGFRRFGFWGVKYAPIVETNGSGKQSRGHKIIDLSTESCGIGGLDTDGLTDSDIVRHHAHYCGIGSTDNTSASVHLRGAGDVNYADFRHTFCKRGVLTGNSSITQGRPNSHSISISGGHTDRMQISDFEHRAFGTRTWNVSDCVFGRGGRQQEHGETDEPTTDEYGSWAVRVDGGSSNPAAPIVFESCVIQIGVDDSYPAGVDRNPYSSPAVGMIVGNVRYVSWNGGVLAGTFHQYHFNGNNKNEAVLAVSADTTLGSGTVDTPVFTSNSTASAPVVRIQWTGSWPPARPGGVAIGDLECMGPTQPPAYLFQTDQFGNSDTWIQTA